MIGSDYVLEMFLLRVSCIRLLSELQNQSDRGRINVKTELKTFFHQKIFSYQIWSRCIEKSPSVSAWEGNKAKMSSVVLQS